MTFCTARVLLACAVAAFAALVVLAPGASYSKGPIIVNLTQTPCMMVEAEEEVREFTSTKNEDCVRINRETAKERTLKPLSLPPGRTVFRVTNKNVPYDVGFWLRGAGLKKFSLPSVSGGGLKTGKTLDYVVDLVPGEYLYSCPLNPTPDYPLTVR